MLRVWLDHAKWIDLARAEHGQPGGDGYRDALAMAKASVAQRHASFVLDSNRYIELHRRPQAASRQRLASVMAAVSDLHALASPRVIVGGEIRQAYHRLFGVPASEPVFPRIFGRGVGFAFGQDDVRYVAPDEIRASLSGRGPGTLAIAEAWATDVLELGALYGPQHDLSPEWRADIDDHKYGRRYINAEIELVAKMDEHGLGKSKLDDVVAATELVDILEPLNTVAAEVGLDLATVLDERDVLEALVQALPSRVVAGTLRRSRLVNRSTKWKPNDLEDISSLALAIPYCDVVITEKSWVHHANVSGLGERFATKITDDVAELVDILVSASVDQS
jgi:hypothetical protein